MVTFSTHRGKDHVPSGRTTEQVAISMDWLPTLLEFAAARADSSYPPDGISLVPVLTGNASPLARKLFWRYKYNAQQAMRDGDMKYLKIDGNTFLFNVVDDPLERANLKDREPELFTKMVTAYDGWNAEMLPLDPVSNTHTFYANQMADHYGNKRK